MERPILFSTPMVQAILEDRKTQTRRVIKIKFLPGYNPEWTGYKPIFEYGEFYLANSRGEPATKPVKCPYGKPGDTLWVRETWQDMSDNKENYVYLADGNEGLEKADLGIFTIRDIQWKPSIHMPREAARLFLAVKNIRVERVQNITEEDARDEGVRNLFLDEIAYSGNPKYSVSMEGKTLVREQFELLWNAINTKRGYGWDINPWVWVVEFEKK